MSSPALKLARSTKRPASRRLPAHIHLPSVHVRSTDGESGFDYEEDIYTRRSGGVRATWRVVRLVAMEHGAIALVRETTDVLCAEELAELQEQLPILMDPENPAAAAMEERARAEFARQRRIAAGEEQACAKCGCSETRACSGGCCWATPTLCSRCV